VSLWSSAVAAGGSDKRSLSAQAVQRLGGLLAGLDVLDPILSLPLHPQLASPGLAFGRFHLQSRLGAGRFGVVLLADDPSLRRQVVVKVPQPTVLADQELRDRFAREAHAAARLDHPGVVTVLEAGDQDGLPYLAAEFVDGPSLREWRQRHPDLIDAGPAAELIRDVARAVHHAHERGVLHCDLTPSNVLLRGPNVGSGNLRDYAAVVTDFGLARLINDDPTSTRTFQVAGTPLYMAPEQARGDRRNLTASIDVYALGALLYELLVGKPPFQGDATDVLSLVQTQPPVPPRQRVPGVPRDLNAICLKCLEKNAEDRYGSAAALADDLDRFLAGKPVAARRISPLVRAARWTARNPLVAGLVVACALLMVAASYFAIDRWIRELQMHHHLSVVAARQEAAAARAEASELRARSAEFYATLERVRQRRQARVAGWTVTNQADLRRIAPLAATDAAAFRTEVASALGTIDLGSPRLIAQDFHGRDAAYNPAGTMLAIGAHAANSDGLGVVRLVDPDAGTLLRQLEYPSDPEWEGRGGGRLDGCWSIRFSPDNKWLVVGTRSGWLRVWELDRTDTSPIASWRHAPPPGDSPETAKIERITELAFDHEGRIWSGDDRTVAAWNPTDEWQESERRSGYLGIPSATGVARPAKVLDDLGATHPALNLFIRRHDNRSLILLRGDGHMVGKLVQPDEDQADDNTITDIAISPDGTVVATTAEHAGHLKLWDLVAGRLLATRVHSPGSLKIAFRPDSRELAVVQQNGVQVYLVHQSDITDSIGLTECPLDDADLSPDGGRYLATAGRIPHAPGVFVVDLENLEGPANAQKLGQIRCAVPVANSHVRLGLAPGGREVTTHEHESFVRIIPPDHKQNFEIRPQATRDIRYSPDGTRWAVGGDSLYIWRRERSQVVSAGGTVTSFTVAYGYCLVGRADGSVVRFSADGELLSTLVVSSAAITALARDGERIIAGTASGDVVVVAPNAPPRTLPQAHDDSIGALAAGPHGWIATGSADRDVRIWNAAGDVLLNLPQTRKVRRLFWSADDPTLIVLAEGERGLRRWHLQRLKSILEQLGSDSGLP
jgi:WD40 repeat protein/tRNA A-37 threonylcarbamoyl transferase component Bud32